MKFRTKRHCECIYYKITSQKDNLSLSGDYKLKQLNNIIDKFTTNKPSL